MHCVRPFIASCRFVSRVNTLCHSGSASGWPREIKELRRVRAGDLRPHPKNWRKHPEEQQNALRGILTEVGFVDALMVRELSDGALQVVDGHLRAETTPCLLYTS